MSTTTIPTQPAAEQERGPSAHPDSSATSHLGETGNTIFASNAGPQRPLSVLHGVEVNVSVEIGRTKSTVKDLLALQVGSVIELDRPAGSPVDLLANNTLIAKGEIVVIDDEFALRITQILDPSGIDGS